MELALGLITAAEMKEMTEQKMSYSLDGKIDRRVDHCLYSAEEASACRHAVTEAIALPMSAGTRRAIAPKPCSLSFPRRSRSCGDKGTSPPQTTPSP